MVHRSQGNPAVAFLRAPCASDPNQFIQEYATYLLEQADAFLLPVPLEKVRSCFQVPVHQQPLSSQQRGFTTDDLRIILNADDLPTVQKFTLAHELMEVLFFALKDGHADHWMSDTQFQLLCDQKERFCDKGAADLIMPLPLFGELVQLHPLTFSWAQKVAARCEVSFTATLWRIIECNLARVILVFWRHKHSPTEFVPSVVGQGNLFGEPTDMDPPKKMRVDRVFAPANSPFIPPDKSVPNNSSIYQAFVEGVSTDAYEQLDLVNLHGRYYVESRPFMIREERHVMSLIHLNHA